MADTFIRNATDSRYVVYRGMRGTPPERVTVVKTVRGAKSAHAQRYRKGEFEGYDEYGWFLEELIDGVWQGI